MIIPRSGSGKDDGKFALGLGVDISFGRNFAVWASGGLGDIGDVGVGLAYIQ
jgi:hypothetical protein